MIKSDILANYDTMLVLLEYNISYAVYEEFIDGVVCRVFYFDTLEDLERARELFKERNL